MPEMGRRETIDTFQDLLGEGFRIDDVASTREHLSITLRKGHRRESLTLDDAEAAELFASDLLGAPPPRHEDDADRDQITTFVGMLRDGFTVTDITSRGEKLTVTLRMGADRETLTFWGEALRALAEDVLTAAPPTEEGPLRQTATRGPP